MIQPSLFYQNINYHGKIDDYYYHKMQEGYEPLGLQPIPLYNPINEGSTISDTTLENLVRQ